MSDPPRRVVTIGGSAGSIEVLREIVAGLRSDIPAAVLIVVHVLPLSESRLPKVLSTRSPLPVRHAVSGDPIIDGTVLVAPPDHHLCVRGDHVELDHGPTENNSRPSIDVLFRSAAREPGLALCGVILSGMLDDGADGLRRLVDAGGLGIVQDPEDALHGDMPANAIASCPACRVVSGSMIARAINGWAGDDPDADERPATTRPSAGDPAAVEPPLSQALRATGLTCPECHGVLWTTDDSEKANFRCRVGHLFTFETLRHLQHAEVERSIWVAVRTLEEEASLCRRIAARAETKGRFGLAMRYGQRHDTTMRRAGALRGLLHHFGDPDPDTRS